MSWRQSRAFGGGFITGGALDPSGSGTMLATGDVSGLHRSENLGSRWYSRNKAMDTPDKMHWAQVKWDTTTPGKAYGLVGNQGVGGGVFVTTDYGATWSLLSATPQFAGNLPGQYIASPPTGVKPLPAHPRSVGNLVEQVGARLHVGTFKQGVMTSLDSGVTWTTVLGATFLGTGAITTNFCRSIALDPADPTVLYVAVFQSSVSSVYKITNAHTLTPTVSWLANGPVEAEELVVLGGVVYAACESGIYKKPATSGDVAWSQIEANVHWSTITGYVDSGTGQTVLYAATGSQVSTPSFHVIKRSVDSGATWTSLTGDASKIHTNVLGTNQTFWLAALNPLGMLGQKQCLTSQLLINPDDRDEIWVFGRAGVWRTDNAFSGCDWYPAVQDMATNVQKRVVVDPNNPSNVVIADADWVTIRSSNGGAAWKGEYPYAQSTDCQDIWYAPWGRCYLATAVLKSNAGGKLFSISPTGRFVNEGYEDAGAIGVALDNFNRTVSSGWGVADIGGVWTQGTNGAASDFNVTPGGATIALSNNGNYIMTLNSTTLTDLDGQLTWKWNVAPIGGNHEVRVLVRTHFSGGTPDAYYALGVRHLVSTGALNIVIRKQFGGTNSLLANADIYASYTPGTNITLSFTIQGTTLNASAWIEGDDPPSSPQVTQTDSSITAAGAIGVLALQAAGATSNPTVTFTGLSSTTLSGVSGGSNGAALIGITGGLDASSNKIVIVAAQKPASGSGAGLWRAVINSPGSAVWTNVSTAPLAATTQPTKLAPMQWVAGSQYVYLFDRASGIWQSRDYGVTWALIWAVTETSIAEGWIAADSINDDLLWVARSSGLYKVTGVKTGTAVGTGMTATAVAAITHPGPIRSAPSGRVYVFTQIGAGVAASVKYSDDSGTTWIDLASEMMPNWAPYVQGIDIDSNGLVYLASNTSSTTFYTPHDRPMSQTVA